jgi:hypothetical protein
MITFKNILISSIIGVLLVMIGTFTIGYTGAIVEPKELHQWAISYSSATISSFLWQLFIVHLLGIGFLAALASYLMVKYSKTFWLWICLAIAFSELSYIYSSLPAICTISTPTSKLIELPLWWHPHELIILLCVFSAGYIAHKHKLSPT